MIFIINNSNIKYYNCKLLIHITKSAYLIVYMFIYYKLYKINLLKMREIMILYIKTHV